MGVSVFAVFDAVHFGEIRLFGETASDIICCRETSKLIRLTLSCARVSRLMWWGLGSYPTNLILDSSCLTTLTASLSLLHILLLDNILRTTIADEFISAIHQWPKTSPISTGLNTSTLASNDNFLAAATATSRSCHSTSQVNAC